MSLHKFPQICHVYIHTLFLCNDDLRLLIIGQNSQIVKER